MDISYLLFLQNIRTSSLEGLSVFFNFISESCVLWFFYVPFIIYWCVSKKAGYWILFNYTCSDAINNLLKNTFCVYRPWIRDSRIVPYGDLQTTTNGYAFPSGHTATAASIGGSIYLWQRKKQKWLLPIMLIYIFLVAFSRTFLGAHTPQDVLGAIVEVTIILYFSSKLFKWTDDKDRRELIVLTASLVFTAVYIVYILVKSYPIDYISNQPVVDSLQMQSDACKAIGGFSSLIVCGYIERHYIGFSTQGSMSQRILRGFIGVIILLCYTSYFRPPIIEALGSLIGNFTVYFLMYAIAIVVYPFIVKTLQINRLYK